MATFDAAGASLIAPRNRAIQLRMATATDQGFLQGLFKAARADEFAAAGLPAAALDILLLAAARGQGSGTDIIMAVGTAAREAGAQELTLSVRAGNLAARRLYARLGFIGTGCGVHIAMVKSLVT